MRNAGQEATWFVKGATLAQTQLRIAELEQDLEECDAEDEAELDVLQQELDFQRDLVLPFLERLSRAGKLGNTHP